jgi:hypothetical protein
MRMPTTPLPGRARVAQPLCTPSSPSLERTGKAGDHDVQGVPRHHVQANKPIPVTSLAPSLAPRVKADFRPPAPSRCRSVTLSRAVKAVTLCHHQTLLDQSLSSFRWLKPPKTGSLLSMPKPYLRRQATSAFSPSNRNGNFFSPLSLAMVLARCGASSKRHVEQ